jgi:hypothetical protein
MGNDQNLSLRGIASTVTFGQPTLRQRSNFAIAHLKAAAHSAREAHRVQTANLGTRHGPWFDEMMIHVPVSIVMAAASVEAAVNEWAQDILDNPGKYQLIDSQTHLVKYLLDDRTGTALSRFGKLCLYLGTVPSMGCAEYENARWLTEFRNHFMHFKPAWDDDGVHDNRLVRALKKKGIPEYGPYKTKFFLPYGFMTYGCANWAVQSAIDFSMHSSAAYGLPEHLSNSMNSLKLP